SFEVHESIMQLMQKASEGASARDALRGLRLFGLDYYMASPAHKEITAEGEDISCEIEQQHAAEMNMVVDEAYDGSSNQPATLHSGHQEGVRLHDLRLWC